MMMVVVVVGFDRRLKLIPRLCKRGSPLSKIETFFTKCYCMRQIKKWDQKRMDGLDTSL